MPVRIICVGLALFFTAGAQALAQGPALAPAAESPAPEQLAAPPNAQYPPAESYQKPAGACTATSWLSMPGIWLMDFAHNVATDFKRNNCWPEPFIHSDRAAVRAPMMVMVANGWQRQNTLSEHHFAESGKELNESGQLKVRWILVHAPIQHRKIFVLAAEHDAETTARVAAVERYLEKVARGESPPVLVTRVAPLGWPATRVDTINRKWQETVPAPRLPASDGGAEETSTNN